jgi:hypothetical protein
LAASADDPIRQALQDELADLRKDEEQLAALAAQAKENLSQSEDTSRLVIEAEIKTEWWKTRLGRESIASIVGGLLLLSLGVSVIVAMFTSTEATDIVANAFLIVLGYFFGSASVGRASPPDKVAT